MVDTKLSLWDINGNRHPDRHESPQFYRQALVQGQAYLKHQFEQQTDIITLVHQRSSFVDQVLQQLWSQFFADE
jgi:UTP:GlnB (protein PII) uridylyltransferase